MQRLPRRLVGENRASSRMRPASHEGHHQDPTCRQRKLVTSARFTKPRRRLASPVGRYAQVRRSLAEDDRQPTRSGHRNHCGGARRCSQRPPANAATPSAVYGARPSQAGARRFWPVDIAPGDQESSQLKPRRNPHRPASAVVRAAENAAARWRWRSQAAERAEHRRSASRARHRRGSARPSVPRNRSTASEHRRHCRRQQRSRRFNRRKEPGGLLLPPGERCRGGSSYRWVENLLLGPRASRPTTRTPPRSRRPPGDQYSWPLAQAQIADDRTSRRKTDRRP